MKVKETRTAQHVRLHAALRAVPVLAAAGEAELG